MNIPRPSALGKVFAPERLSRRSALRGLGTGGLAAAALAGGVSVGQSRLASAQDDNGGCCNDCCREDEGAQDLILPEATQTTLPGLAPDTAGRVRRLVDYDRGVWLDTGERWVGLTGEVFNVQSFGALGDGATDDWDAFNFAIESMTSALESDTTSAFGRTLYVPPGVYRLSQALVLTRSVRLVGASTGSALSDSVLRFDPGITGVVVQAANPGVSGLPGRRGEGTIIERLRIEAGSGTDLLAGAVQGAATPGPAGPDAVTPVATEGSDALTSTIHGVLLRARASVLHCSVAGFGGDGIHVEVEESGPVGADAGGWHVDHCDVTGCGGNGLFAGGVGANGGACTLLTATDNAGWGIADNSSLGNTYVQCRTRGNAQGAYTSGGGSNRSLFVGCSSEQGQPLSVFGDATLVVGGDVGAGYQGGNAWTAVQSRVLLRAQEPGAGETPIPTVPTLHLQAANGQTQPHLRISDQRGARLAEVDAAGRLLVGPADLLLGTGGDAPQLPPVQVQISDDQSGEAAIRWVLTGDFTGWAAQARAFLDVVGEGEGDAVGYGGVRLTFQTPDSGGRELDTLTLRQGRAGLGTSNPAPAALLEMASTSQGFLPPRMTTEQRDAISSPPEGLVIYNSSTRRLNFFDRETWQEVAIPVVGG